MPRPQNKKSNPTKDRKKQVNKVGLEGNSEKINAEENKAFGAVECDSDVVNLDSEEKSKNVASKRVIENKIDLQNFEDGSNIPAKNVKLENNSDFEEVLPKVKEEIEGNGDNIKFTNQVEIVIDSDSEDTPIQEIKKEKENSASQIKIEKDFGTEDKSNISKETILATIPKVDHISVGEIKIEDGNYKASSASEDEYSENEMKFVVDEFMELGSDCDEDDIPSTSRAHSRKIKGKSKDKKSSAKLKKETNNESDSDPDNSQIPSDEDAEFLSTASGCEEFLSDSEEESPDNEELTLENKDVVTQLIQEYHTRPQLWFEDLSTELSAVKENQLYRSIKDNLNKKFNKEYNLKRVKKLVNLLCLEYEKEIERQLQENEETVAESSSLWFYDKLNFIKDDIESKAKLRLEKSLKLLDNNILMELIDIYKNYDGLWDRNNLSFTNIQKRREIMRSMCLEIKQKLQITLNSFKLEYQLLHLHKMVTEEKKQRFRCERTNENYKPFFPLITRCDFIVEHQEPFKCNVCKVDYESYHLFKQHQALHNGTPQFQCNICGIAFNARGNFYNHNYRHNGINYNCSICGKEFMHPKKLKLHIDTIHVAPFEDNVYNCDVCGKGFDHPKKRANHKQYMHKGETLECKICNKVFKNRRLLKNHNVRACFKIYKCDFCKRSYLDPNGLKKHIDYYHLFECNICKKSCSDQKSLDEHMTVHKAK